MRGAMLRKDILFHVSREMDTFVCLHTNIEGYICKIKYQL
jgi:hypothetical protein